MRAYPLKRREAEVFAAILMMWAGFHERAQLAFINVFAQHLSPKRIAWLVLFFVGLPLVVGIARGFSIVQLPVFAAFIQAPLSAAYLFALYWFQDIIFRFILAVLVWMLVIQAFAFPFTIAILFRSQAAHRRDLQVEYRQRSESHQEALIKQYQETLSFSGSALERASAEIERLATIAEELERKCRPFGGANAWRQDSFVGS